MNRLYHLDYLRGLSAFGIMIFHLMSWSLGTYSSETWMGRVGTYGVSAFYVLSGLTLYYVYYNKMNFTQKDILFFFKKRALRIFPLLWLVTVTAVVLSRQVPDIGSLFLNLTGLFGFFKWDSSFSAGDWSIGNEWVFYLFFPFFILLMKKFKPLMVLLILILFGLYLYFAFVKLNPALALGEQWRNYVNPLNQVFLFVGGFLMGYFLQDVKVSNWVPIVLLLLGFALFSFYPASGDNIVIVTGVNRLVFTGCTFLICIGFYKLSIQLPMFVHKPLTILGEASYSIYLLHPIVWKLTNIGLRNLSEQGFEIPPFVSLPLSAFLTVFISYYVYQYFEKYFMKLGEVNNTNR